MKCDNVPGCKGYYISPRGHLYSRIDKQGRITPRLNKKGTYVKLRWHKVNLSVNHGGYLYKTIQIDYHKVHLSIHRLVAKVYIPNKDRSVYNVVMHLDNDRTNNRVSNLKWGTAKENVNQAIQEGRLKRKSKYNVDGIIQSKMKGISSKEVARLYGLTTRYVNIFWKRYRDQVSINRK